MQSYTATYTKVFTPDSLLAGLTYPETESNLTADQVARLRGLLQVPCQQAGQGFWRQQLHRHQSDGHALPLILTPAGGHYSPAKEPQSWKPYTSEYSNIIVWKC